MRRNENSKSPEVRRVNCSGRSLEAGLLHSAISQQVLSPVIISQESAAATVIPGKICRQNHRGSRQGQAASCAHESQHPGTLAKNLVWDPQLCLVRQSRLFLPGCEKGQNEIRISRLPQQGEPRLRHHVAGHLRPEVPRLAKARHQRPRTSLFFMKPEGALIICKLSIPTRNRGLDRQNSCRRRSSRRDRPFGEKQPGGRPRRETP